MFGSTDSVTALAKIGEGLDELLKAGLDPSGSRDAVEVIRAIESVGRRVAAAQSELVDVIDQRALYSADGHTSAKVMVRHVAKLSAGEAAGRVKVAKMLRDLPEIARRLRAGSLGVDQVRLLGRVHANTRVRAHMADAETWFLKLADREVFPRFERAVRQWERLTDSDGAEPKASRNRKASMVQNGIDLSWELSGSFGSMQGLSVDEIFDHYLQAELLADWEKARAEHGEEATAADLPRTAAQRSADALWQVFQDAAANPDGAVPVNFVHNIVWDARGYEEMLRRLSGAEATPLDFAGFRCSTIDGVAVDPSEAAANSLVESMRRVVVGASGVVIDQGRARAFTANARLAVLIADDHCTHPGCWIPASQCQIDHTRPYASGGTTTPANGGPRCGHHNRHKERGYTVWRDPAGMWHTIRPDGTEIE